MTHDPLANLALADATAKTETTADTGLPCNEVPALHGAGLDEAPVEQPDGRVLKLDSCLTIAEVGLLAGQLAGIFDSGDSLVLDGSEIAPLTYAV